MENTEGKDRSIMREIRACRRSVRAHLQSIRSDWHVVQQVMSVMHGLPLVANLRNGLWYAPPENFSATCYFKSTDGHALHWKFSSSRINLHIAQLAAEKDGCVIVDSTRRGKSFPDALYATLPIWMAVLNCLLFPTYDSSDLFHSPPWMPSSTRDQILQLLPSLVASVSAFQRDTIRSNLSKKLIYPLRPIWVVPDRDGVLEWSGDISESLLERAEGNFSRQGVTNTETNDRYIPIVLLSCSKDIDPQDQNDHCNWEYIKGAGDDEENWSKGLTPKLFWAHVEEILSPDIDARGTEEVVDRLVAHGYCQEDLNPDSFIEIGNMKCFVWPYKCLTLTGGSTKISTEPIKDSRKYVLLHNTSADTVNGTVDEMIDIIKRGGSKFITIEMKTGKRENPKNYWRDVVFPKCIDFVLDDGENTDHGTNSSSSNKNEDVIFCYDASASHHIDACAIIIVALLAKFIGDQEKDKDELKSHSLQNSRKELYKDILLQIQMVYPIVNPPRRFMKELCLYFDIKKKSTTGENNMTISCKASQSSSHASSSPVIRLTYLDIPGFAEPIRLCLKLGGVKFVDRRVTYQEIAKMRERGELPWSQVPILEVGDETYGQSTAILRWAGRKTGFYPEGLEFRIDCMIEAIGDIHKAMIPQWYHHAVGRSPVNGNFYEKTKLTEEQQAEVLHALNNDIIKSRFELIEKCHIERFKAPTFLCGDVITIADLMLYTLVTGLKDEQNSFCSGISPLIVFSGCNYLLTLVDRIEARMSDR